MDIFPFATCIVILLATVAAIVIRRRRHRAHPSPVLTSKGELARRCSCYLTQNFFIGEIDGLEIQQHFEYTDKASFVKDNASALRKIPGDKVSKLLDALESEKQRRAAEADIKRMRRKIISDAYKMRDGSVTRLSPDDISPALIHLTSAARKRLTKDALVRHTAMIELGTGVYAFPCLEPSFCNRLVKEMDWAHKCCDRELQQKKINSMNRHGMSLDELGFTPGFSNLLVERYIAPIVECVYGSEMAKLDHHRCFTVRYSADHDRKLTLHYDNSLVTLNINIEHAFQGSEVELWGDRSSKPSQDEYLAWKHRLGWGLLHLGRMWHRALPISEGRRTNVIMWMRSSAYTAKHGCLMCGNQEDMVNKESS